MTSSNAKTNSSNNFYLNFHTSRLYSGTEKKMSVHPVHPFREHHGIYKQDITFPAIVTFMITDPQTKKLNHL